MLKKIIEKLFCKHKWQVHSKIEVYGGEHSKTPHTMRQTLICQECGKITKIKL
jgi:hypothetical protein